MTVYDHDLKIQKSFFEGIGKHLKTNGRAYVTQSNFGTIGELKNMADKNRFHMRLIGENAIKNDPRIFYAFELRRIT